MRVLVTGGAGFIGSHIVEELVRAGHTTVVVDNLSSGRREQVRPEARFYSDDITSPTLAEIFAQERPEAVIHQAAQVSVAASVLDPVRDARVNVMGTLNVLEQCRAHDVRKVVFASSAAVYGDPVALPVDEDHPIKPASPYGLAKRVCEEYLRIYRKLHGLDYTVLRYANVYGPRQDALGEGGVVAIFTRRVVRGEPVEIHGDGGQTRDFVFVRDVARANLCALDRAGGEHINVSCGTETSIKNLLDVVAEAVGARPGYRQVAERPGDIRRSVLANARAEALLGWRPEVSLSDGLAQVVEYEAAALRSA